MFPLNETVLGAEAAYRREQLLVSLPAHRALARREPAHRQALASRVAARVAGRRDGAATPTRTGQLTGQPTATPQGRAAATAQRTPDACAA